MKIQYKTMVNFTSTKIQNQTLGKILQRARKEKGASLSEAERNTRIRKVYLEALERGNKSQLPADIYIENFLKTYALFLNLEFEPLKKIYYEEAKMSYLVQDNKKSKKLSLHNFIVTPQIIKVCLVVLATAGLLFYLGFEIEKNFSPPYLFVDSPIDNLRTSKSTIQVEGQTEKEVKVTINGQEILSDENGNFEESVNLQDGLNIIEISSKKKRSKENMVYRRVMLVTE